MLHQLNALPTEDAERVFLQCCGAREWATRMAQLRPFAAVADLLAAADRVWLNLSEVDWLEAFATHPRIGDRTGSAASQREQGGVIGAADETMQALIAANEEYERRYGFIFIVFATGKSADEMLQLLLKRLGNDRDTELRIAAAEQMKITRLRLKQLLESSTLTDK